MRKTLLLLALCQALSITMVSLILSSAALIGEELAPVKSWATIPVGLQFLTTMLVMFPASILMQYKGRRFGFILGATCMMLAGVLSALAIYWHQFWLLCLGLSVAGVAVAFFQYLRFAALDVAIAGWESRAVSWVLAGGLLAAFTGPNLAAWTRNWIQGYEFAASYLAAVPIGLVVLFVMSVIHLPMPLAEEKKGPARPLEEIVRQYRFVVAVVGAMVAYGVMNLLMTATPLAMHGHQFHFEQTAFIIQWHIVGMFLPSFFTGSLIHRFGVLPIMLIGVALFLSVVAVNMAGQSIAHYWIALVALGIGWNFLYIGGTTLLSETYQPAEKNKVQGLNDTLVFTLTALTALSSGVLYDSLGWLQMNWLTVPLTGFIGGLILRLLFIRRT